MSHDEAFPAPITIAAVSRTNGKSVPRRFWLGAFCLAIGLSSCRPKPLVTQDDFEQAYFTKMRESLQAGRAKEKSPWLIEEKGAATDQALEAAYANAVRTIGAELDQASELYREPRRDLYLYALGCRNLLAAQKHDTETRKIVAGAIAVAKAAPNPPTEPPSFWLFTVAYRKIRLAKLSHEAAIAQLTKPPTSQSAGLPVSGKAGYTLHNPGTP